MVIALRTPQSFRERVGALRHLPPFVHLVWDSSPALTLASFTLRLVRAVIPVVALYVGKLIIDAVVAEARLPHAGWSTADWVESGRLVKVGGLAALEFGLAVMTDFSGRLSALVDSLLAETYSNFASIRLMAKAASLDLEQFESSDQQDRLDRARRQVTGRTALLGLVFGQIQDILTAVSFVIGLAAYWPWLIVLMLIALVPSLLAEVQFNAQGYRLDYFRTPERRQLDYVRYLGSSVETAKEVKLFGLNQFLIERFRRFAETMFVDNRRLATRRAIWGGLFAALGTVAYYVAYGAIIWRTMAGGFSLGDMTFLVGSFLRLKSLLDGLLLGFSQVAGQALYLDDLFSFFDIRPRIVSPLDPLPAPKRIRTGFVFEDVGFRYEDAERWAVRHLDLEIRAGEVLALVGENGAGKTTIVSCCPGFTTRRRPHPARSAATCATTTLKNCETGSASSFKISSASTLPPPRTSRWDGSRRRRPRSDRAGGQPKPCRCGHRPIAARLRPAARPALQWRRRSVGRGMAEDRYRAGLYARRRRARPRRADIGARRPLRI